MKRFFLICGLAALLIFSHQSLFVRAEPDCDNPGPSDLDYCIEKIGQEIETLKPAHEYNKKELAGLRTQVTKLNNRIAVVTTQLEKVAADINQRQEDLAYTQIIFNEKAANYYRLIRIRDPLAPFFSSTNASQAFRERAFHQKVVNADRVTMEQYATDLIALKNDQDALEKNKSSLAASKAKLDKQVDFLAGEVAKVEAYLATLSAKQEAFIAQKLGSLNLPPTLGAGHLYCTDDRNLNPGFSPAFAFYTYGIPHRVGMNQFGAYGRSKAGQNHEQILQAYFDNFSFTNWSNINITVDGYGAMPLETYLLGIYEMPSDWPIEALKAQAIAARSYALAYTNNGANSICTSQQCQVYKGGNKGGGWEQAVQATAGKVMVSGGQPIKAWYASTAGGYTFNSGDVWGNSTSWTKRMRDTTGGVGGFGDLNGTAYDKESPCFYAAQGWRKPYDNSAWLKPEEVADIVNVLKLAKADPSVTEHLYQTDKGIPDTWDEGRVKSELQSRGITPFNSVSSVSVSADFSGGRSTSVVISGESFDASEFKNYINLRAPANIQIVGPLFNVERKS